MVLPLLKVVGGAVAVSYTHLDVYKRQVCEGVTMQDVLKKLEQQYGWSRSISNLSGKLHRETLRYKEAVELADVLGYEIVWKKRG